MALYFFEYFSLGNILNPVQFLFIGSTANGTVDGFYGATRPRIIYNVSAVIESRAGRILSRLSDSLYLPKLSIRDILATRSEATVRCNTQQGPSSRSPCPRGEACLFDMASDPCETTNLAKRYLDVSTQLYQVLKYYRRQLVAQTNQPIDVNANPTRFNNTWSTWMY